jgi:homoserine kinase type II
MSVYTIVSQPELEGFLGHYDLGELIDFQGISAGIENTNYFVTTTRQQLVLTLFEQHSAAEMGYFLDLMAFLAEHQVPSAHPIADRHGHYLRELNGKPAALVMRLNGAGIEQPNLAQCHAIGQALAALHRAGQSFPGQRTNDRGPRWWHQTRNALFEHLSGDDQQLLDQELAYQDRFRLAELPRGVIHADLFRDNALFEGDTLTGIIDFYYACNDALLYDVAVTVNDWCSLADGGIDEAKLRALLGAYHRTRPFSAEESEAWPVMLRAAALRFWLSRLRDLHFPREGELTHTKDPQVFRNILLHRKQHADQLTRLWQDATLTLG